MSIVGGSGDIIEGVKLQKWSKVKTTHFPFCFRLSFEASYCSRWPQVSRLGVSNSWCWYTRNTCLLILLCTQAKNTHSHRHISRHHFDSQLCYVLPPNHWWWHTRKG